MTSPWTRAGGLTPISEILIAGDFRRFAPATVKINHVMRVLQHETGHEIPERFGPVLGHCESTPEAVFLWHFCQRLNATPASNGSIVVGEMVVVPQYVWERYRLDFLIATTHHTLCVEIDGLSYHRQDDYDAIEQDYQRQRAIVARLCPVMRFVARELREVVRCWADVDAFFADRNQHPTRGKEDATRV